MFRLILGILILVVTIFLRIFYLPGIARGFERTYEGEKGKKLGRNVKNSVLAVGLILSIVVMFFSLVVVLQPGEVGKAYSYGNTATDLKVGYNFVPPWAKMYRWDATMHVITFSQGNADDDIYGAQTLEKDYIEVVATMGVRIDQERMDEYVATYGSEQLSSSRITTVLKTISRNAVERAIGSYTTAEVMGNKKKISEEATSYFQQALANMPLNLEYFTIDDLVAPESYENAIREQAQLRMDREKAALQQDLNQQQAAADKIKAEGEAAVLQTQAEAQATVKKIEAENAASVAKTKADSDAEVLRIAAEAAASVKKIQAEADAQEITTKANAEATAKTAIGEAEAKAIAAQGEAYKQNPELIQLKIEELKAEVQSNWAEHWSGYSFEGMSGFNFADLTGVLQGLLSGNGNPTIPNASQNPVTE